ncbi:MAG: DUF2442 domain-containing protein [Oscillospiraceae bacterium]|nr:DUF2442 domain-containing protein [Oscillospiraceae bacterium]
MREQEDIIFGKPLNPRVLDVLPTEDYKLFLTFNNGEKRVFDVKNILNLPAFKKLSNKEFFKAVKTEYGTIAWGNDIDYCPDTLYNESVLIN